MGTARRHHANAPGPWFVDESCIDCDVSRQCAPSIFGADVGQSVVVRQPATPDEIEAATRAMLACPTGSIHAGASEKLVGVTLFPAPIDGDVYFTGYASEKSFGANAFFARRARGNLLVDAPRWVPSLAKRLEELGGVAHVLLTHRDDVADAERYAKHFGARVWIHEDDRAAAPFATDVIAGLATQRPTEDVLAIPAPGHTRGSVVYLLDERFLFTGDSLYWSRAAGDLSAFRGACWYSWDEQARSLARVAEHRFEWVLAGHGDRARRPAPEMHERLVALVARMASTSFDGGAW